jgi:hypothetical protein
MTYETALGTILDSLGHISAQGYEVAITGTLSTWLVEARKPHERAIYVDSMTLSVALEKLHDKVDKHTGNRCAR